MRGWVYKKLPEESAAITLKIHSSAANASRLCTHQTRLVISESGVTLMAYA